MAKINNSIYLKHILEAIDKVSQHLEGKSYKAFVEDEVLLGFIIYEIAVIGEAASQLSEDFTEKHSHIAWSKMVGMRNWLIHGYYKINTKTLWETSTENLPELKKQIDEII